MKWWFELLSSTPQPAIWSYDAADCQPTAAVLSVSLVQSAGTLCTRLSKVTGHFFRLF